MGNRAVITIAHRNTRGNVVQQIKEDDIGVYLHWNGGRDSVRAFLAYCDIKGYRPPEIDDYGWARLCQVIGNFFGGTDSVGIDVCKRLDCDNYDNGVYLIENWKIVGRVYHDGSEQNAYDILDMLMEINNRQPEKERVTDEYIKEYVVKRLW